MLYVVIQTGVYRHGIVGVWDSLELAKMGAEAALAAEPDDWHHMEVVETPLNLLGEDKVVARLRRVMKRMHRTDGIRGTLEVDRQWWVEGEALERGMTAGRRRSKDASTHRKVAH